MIGSQSFLIIFFNWLLSFWNVISGDSIFFNEWEESSPERLASLEMLTVLILQNASQSWNVSLVTFEKHLAKLIHSIENWEIASFN